jgi:hypothetical protein
MPWMPHPAEDPRSSGLAPIAQFPSSMLANGMPSHVYQYACCLLERIIAKAHIPYPGKCQSLAQWLWMTREGAVETEGAEGQRSAS